MGGEEAINSAARLISVSFLVTKFAFHQLNIFHRPKDAIKAIKKRLSAPKDFKVVILTLTVTIIFQSASSYTSVSLTTMTPCEDHDNISNIACRCHRFLKGIQSHETSNIELHCLSLCVFQ